MPCHGASTPPRSQHIHSAALENRVPSLPPLGPSGHGSKEFPPLLLRTFSTLHPFQHNTPLVSHFPRTLLAANKVMKLPRSEDSGGFQRSWVHVRLPGCIPCRVKQGTLTARAGPTECGARPAPGVLSCSLPGLVTALGIGQPWVLTHSALRISARLLPLSAY